MNNHGNLGAVARQSLVNGVVKHLKYQMMKSGAVRGVANIHARALSHRIEALENLN